MNLREMAAKAVNSHSDMGNLISGIIGAAQGGVANARYMGVYNDMTTDEIKAVNDAIRNGESIALRVNYDDGNDYRMFYSANGCSSEVEGGNALWQIAYEAGSFFITYFIVKEYTRDGVSFYEAMVNSGSIDITEYTVLEMEEPS